MLDDVRYFMNRRPFHPFRIVATNGRAYEVESPDLIAVGRTELTCYAPKSDRKVVLRPNQIALLNFARRT